jgi:hypothetical protein
MAFLSLHGKNQGEKFALALIASLLVQIISIVSAPAQSLGSSALSAFGASSSAGSAATSEVSESSSLALSISEAPQPAMPAANPDRPNVAASAVWHQVPFSRIGIGADVSPLGIGIKGAIVLDDYFDARADADYFNLNVNRFEIEGFDTSVNLHLASAAVSLDWYPHNSIWRLSPGLLFYNANQLKVAANLTPGTNFTLDGQNYYSATKNDVTGATPLAGTGILGLHTTRPAVTVAGGFGRFVPHSNRHWSFPSEFGVAFTGAPSANVNVSGWACLDQAQTQCSNVGDKSNTVAIDFNNSLQSSLTKWRRDLAKVSIYPLFSYSVVYSFNIR